MGMTASLRRMKRIKTNSQLASPVSALRQTGSFSKARQDKISALNYTTYWTSVKIKVFKSGVYWLIDRPASIITKDVGLPENLVV